MTFMPREPEAFGEQVVQILRRHFPEREVQLAGPMDLCLDGRELWQHVYLWPGGRGHFLRRHQRSVDDIWPTFLRFRRRHLDASHLLPGLISDDGRSAGHDCCWDRPANRRWEK